MIKKVGNVSIDYTFYAGSDLYSDGDVEDELLDIVKNYPKSEFNRIIDERNKWPILYHLSHIRENILNWYPFEKDATVLEIGSGCGAITGAVASKVKSVTCIELSEKRSLINAHRNNEHDNILIRLGNFETVEKEITEKYDYITLIGVLEYANVYINSNNPYEDFLNKIISHLKPNGKLIVAIENRLGMKYFAGCREDHNGYFFEGIEEYSNTNGAKTFSKNTLEKLFSKVGFNKQEFYYPYPDYKFPMAIYSDECLPKIGELDRNIRNMDADRMMLFNEALALNGMVDDGLFPLFSNSFLVELERGK